MHKLKSGSEVYSIQLLVCWRNMQWYTMRILRIHTLHTVYILYTAVYCSIDVYCRFCDIPGGTLQSSLVPYVACRVPVPR